MRRNGAREDGAGDGPGCWARSRMAVTRVDPAIGLTEPAQDASISVYGSSSHSMGHASLTLSLRFTSARAAGHGTGMQAYTTGSRHRRASRVSGSPGTPPNRTTRERRAAESHRRFEVLDPGNSDRRAFPSSVVRRLSPPTRSRLWERTSLEAPGLVPFERTYVEIAAASDGCLRRRSAPANRARARTTTPRHIPRTPRHRWPWRTT